MGCTGFLEGDQSAGELEQGEVVLRFLRPADQERPVAVQPGVAGLDNPATRAPAWGVQLASDFLAAAADVRGEAVLVGELVHPRVVVAAVKVECLWPFRRWLGPRDRNGVKRRR